MFRIGGRRRVVFAALGLAGASTGWFLWHTQRALDETRTEVRRENALPIRVRTLDRLVIAGLESMPSAGVFRDAALFQQRLWVLSSDALWEYDASGALLHRYSCGVDLPSAPLVKLATGVGSEPQLYIATQGEGLVVYDGQAFRQIRPEQANYRKITSLLPLESGQLLLGTETAGVVVWDGRSLSRFHESLGGMHVTALAGKLDNLWAGTLDRGVLHLHAGQVERFSDNEGLPDAHVLSLAVEGDAAWAGTAMGVAQFQAGKFQRVLAEGTFANALVWEQDTLLAGTIDEGVVEIPLKTRQPRPGFPPRDAAGHVERLLRVGGETYAIFRDGLYTRQRRGTWQKAAGGPEALLSDNNIAALAVEPSGRLWVGYFDRGLDIIDPGMAHAIHREDDHLFCVNRIVPRKDGAAIGTANGLVLTDTAGNPRQVLGRREGLIASHVTDVLLQPDGMVVATPAGLTFLAPGGPSSIYAFHGLVNNHVYALAQNGGRVLAGTLGGISVLDSGVVKASYTTANSALRHNWISALAAVGDEWFAGTYGAGVFRFDGTTWHPFADLRPGFEVNPNAMIATDTAVYAGTLGRGLAVYNRSNGRWGFTAAGLPSGNVTAIAAGNGYLYIGTENGLVKVAERSLFLP